MKTLLIPYSHHQTPPTSGIYFSQSYGVNCLSQTAFILSGGSLNELYDETSIPDAVVNEFLTDSVILHKEIKEYPTISTRLVYFQLASRDLFRLQTTLNQSYGFTADVSSADRFFPHARTYCRCASSLNSISECTLDPLHRSICNKFANETFRIPLWIDYDLLTGEPENLKEVNLLAETYAVFVVITDRSATLDDRICVLHNQGYNVSGQIVIDTKQSVFGSFTERIRNSKRQFVYVSTSMSELEDSQRVIRDEVDGNPFTWRFCVSTDNSAWDSPGLNRMVNDEDDPVLFVKHLSEVTTILNYFRTEFEAFEEYPNWIKENYHVCYRYS